MTTACEDAIKSQACAEDWDKAIELEMLWEARAAEEENQ